MIKSYKLIVDQDTIPFHVIKLDPETKVPITEKEIDIEEIYESNPIITDITNEVDNDLPEEYLNSNRIKMVSPNTGKEQKFIFSKEDSNQMIFAALLSNPQIVFDLIE
jgi:hypothetical protein